MKTEEEARQCWCPFARLGFEGAIEDVTFAYAANRWADAGAMKSCNCIASECMAWRWGALGPEGKKGFCGLAGKP